MNYNESIKNYFFSFLDPIQKLNAMEAELEQIKITEENLVLDSVFNSLPEETFKSETKNLNEIKDWIHSKKEEIYTSNKSLLKETEQKSWPGHKRLPFPVAWDRESFNKVEKFIELTGQKKKWIDWITKNLRNGEYSYWRYKDWVLNAATVDLNFYIENKIIDEEEFYGNPFARNTFKDYLSTLSDDFFNFLFNVKRVTALSSKEEDKNLQKPTHQFEKEYSQLEKLIIRTMKARSRAGKDLNWYKVMCDLKNYTLENEEVFTGDVVTSKTEKVMLGVKLYIKGYSEPIQTIPRRYCETRLTSFRKLVLAN